MVPVLMVAAKNILHKILKKSYMCVPSVGRVSCDHGLSRNITACKKKHVFVKYAENSSHSLVIYWFILAPILVKGRLFAIYVTEDFHILET
jgi:hypothetical protein